MIKLISPDGTAAEAPVRTDAQGRRYILDPRFPEAEQVAGSRHFSGFPGDEPPSIEVRPSDIAAEALSITKVEIDLRPPPRR